jgi:hypothetical protein
MYDYICNSKAIKKGLGTALIKRGVISKKWNKEAFWVSNPLCLPPPRPSIFSQLFFSCPPPC